MNCLSDKNRISLSVRWRIIYFKSNFANTFWWRQLVWREEWTPELKSKDQIHTWMNLYIYKFPKMCVGSVCRINWCRPKWEVMVPIILPLQIVPFKRYQFFDFALRSQITASIKGLLSTSLSKAISRFFENESNSSWFWLGAL